MTIQRPRGAQGPATSDEHAEIGERDATDSSAQTRRLVSANADRDRDPNWPWQRTLRLAILLSGAFWLVVGLLVWAYLRAG